MKPLDRDTAMAINRLASDNNEFEKFMSWITDSYMGQLEATIDLDGTKVQRGQGQCEALRDIISVVTNIRATLNRMQK